MTTQLNHKEDNVIGKALTVGTMLLTAVILLAGCGDDTPTGSVSEVSLVRTSPTDGATSVDVDGPIHMMFNEPVDTVQFHDWFYCVEGEMHDAWADSLAGGMMDMGGMQFDSTMLYGRMHDGGIGGEFHWNDDADSCVFMPDSSFMHDSEYVLHFRDEMRNREGGRMMHMGEMFSEDIMFRFHTMGP